MTLQESNAYIIDGNILIFLGTPAPSLKQDILHSCLLASLVSNTKNIDTADWFSEYNKALSKSYWALQGTSSKNITKKPISLLQSIEEAGSSLTPTDLQNVRKYFSLIRQLPKDSAAYCALLNKIQRQTNDETDQLKVTLCPVVTVVNENKLSCSFHLTLNVAEPVDIHFLDAALPEEKILGDIQIIHRDAYLQENNYSAVRDRIIEKLGNRVKTNLFAIETPTVRPTIPAA